MLLSARNSFKGSRDYHDASFSKRKERKRRGKEEEEIAQLSIHCNDAG